MAKNIVFIALFLMLVGGVLFFWFLGLGPRFSEMEATGGPSSIVTTSGDDMEESEIDPAYPPRTESASSQRPQLDDERVTKRRLDPDEIPANLIASVRRNSLNADGTVSDSLIDLLSLDPDQVSFLNEHIRATASRLMQEELVRMTSIQVSDYEVKLHVPALPESHQIEDQFRQGVTDYLGEPDGRLFIDLIDTSHRGYFDGFGRFDRTIRFSIEPRENGGYRVEFRQESPLEQLEHFYAERGSGISGEDREAGRSFMALFPLRLQPPRALGRSAYLLDVLPAEMRHVFEEIERNATGR